MKTKFKSKGWRPATAGRGEPAATKGARQSGGDRPGFTEGRPQSKKCCPPLRSKDGTLPGINIPHDELSQWLHREAAGMDSQNIEDKDTRWATCRWSAFSEVKIGEKSRNLNVEIKGLSFPRAYNLPMFIVFLLY